MEGGGGGGGIIYKNQKLLVFVSHIINQAQKIIIKRDKSTLGIKISSIDARENYKIVNHDKYCKPYH